MNQFYRIDLKFGALGAAPPSHAELFAHAIPQAHLCRLPGRDHQLNNDLSEIAAVIKSLAAAA